RDVITHPEKLMFPEDGITKGELASYYEAIATIMLPHIRARPITMERFPSGIGKPGFMHKDVSKGFPGWLERVEVPKKGGTVRHPLDGQAGFGEVSWFAHAVGAMLVERDPAHLTQEFSKADRGGRIYVDTGRNGYSATVAAAYAVRARPGAPVSAPCTWPELERGEVGPRTFTLRAMAGRVAAVGDLWSDMRGRSSRPAMERLRRRLRAV